MSWQSRWNLINLEFLLQYFAVLKRDYIKDVEYDSVNLRKFNNYPTWHKK